MKDINLFELSWTHLVKQTNKSALSAPHSPVSFGNVSREKFQKKPPTTFNTSSHKFGHTTNFSPSVIVSKLLCRVVITPLVSYFLSGGQRLCPLSLSAKINERNTLRSGGSEGLAEGNWASFPLGKRQKQGAWVGGRDVYTKLVSTRSEVQMRQP